MVKKQENSKRHSPIEVAYYVFLEGFIVFVICCTAVYEQRRTDQLYVDYGNKIMWLTAIIGAMLVLVAFIE